MMKPNFSRRDFLFQTATGALGLSLLSNNGLLSALSNVAQANLIERQRNVLVVVFLRGGFDGLGLVCPRSGPDRTHYEAARPTLALPLTGESAAIPLNDNFALNRAALPLHALYERKQLAFIHACGLNTPSRSHFAAQLQTDLGNAKPAEFNTGWLTRFIGASPCKAAAIGPLSPASYLGTKNLFAFARLKGLGLDGSEARQRLLRTTLRNLYQAGGEKGFYGQMVLDMLDDLEDLGFKQISKNLPELPSAEIPQRFALASHLIKNDPSLSLLTIDVGGWDTHRQQGTLPDGYFYKQLSTLSQSLSDFHSDMETSSNAWVTTLVFSEFGRRLKENASRGTDHGYGNVVWLCGPKVQGGQIHGRWPGLANEQLFERSDLTVTTDLRQVFGECLKHLAPNLELKRIFTSLPESELKNLFIRTA